VKAKAQTFFNPMTVLSQIIDKGWHLNTLIQSQSNGQSSFEI